MNKSILLVGALAFGGLAVPAMAGNLVTNGDFETGASSFTTPPGYTGQGSNPAEITGWTGTGLVGINPGNGAGNQFANNGADLTNVAFLEQTASLSQSVSGFVVGSTYECLCSFNATAGLADPTFVATIGGITLDSFSSVSPVDSAGVFNTPYHSDSETFVATSTTMLFVLSTSSTTGADSSLLLDNITLSSVPEPSSVVMGVTAVLAGVAYCWRRRCAAG